MDWKDIITWLLVIVGWFIVHIVTMSRERLKENRDAALRIVEEIRRVEEISVEFQTSTEFSDEKYDLLVWRISRIAMAIYRPPLKHLQISTDIVIKFRQNLTMNTDKSKFVTQSHNEEIIKNIHEATDNLISEIEVQKYIYFT
ncbi:MAG: hypothetical protein Q8K59_08835 [Nitrosomonas sp.]|nr:hypothetical protein [Nitrosomonas sp.]MDP1951181.1 hypothetical protein [Nitrosomonas sp.]